MQATISESQTGNKSSMSDASTTGLVSFSEGGRSLFATGGNAGALMGTQHYIWPRITCS